MNNGAFISYRRKSSWATAELIYKNLKRRRVDVYMDLNNLGSGQFDTTLLEEIEKRPYFLIILQEGSLERCKEPDDWLLRELDHAWKSQRTIIPVWTSDFSFEDAKSFLPEYLASELPRFNGLHIPQEYFKEAMKRLHHDFLKPVTDVHQLDRVVPPLKTRNKSLKRDVMEPPNSRVKSIDLKLVAEFVLPEQPSRNRINVLKFTPDGKYLVAALNQDRVAIWDTNTRELENMDAPKLSTRYMEHTDWPTRSVAISPSQKLIASPTYERAIQLWQFNGLKPYRLIETVNYGATSISFSPDGKWLVAGLDHEGYIYSWSTDDDFRSTDYVKAHDDRVEALKFHPHKLSFVSCSVDGYVKLWEIVEEEIKEVGYYDGHDGKHVVDVAFSPTGIFLASGSVKGQVFVWETETGQPIRNLHHESVVRTLAFSPDSKLLASGSNDRTLKIWNVGDGRKLISKKFEHAVRTVDFSPDGQFLITSAESTKKAQIWRIELNG